MRIASHPTVVYDTTSANERIVSQPTSSDWRRDDLTFDGVGGFDDKWANSEGRDKDPIFDTLVNVLITQHEDPERLRPAPQLQMTAAS